jgi:hypothetical protein
MDNNIYNLENQEENYEEELQQDDVIDEQDIEEDGYVEDEGNDEGSEEEVIDAPEDFKVGIPIYNQDGTVDEAVLNQDELAEFVNKGRHYDALYQQANQIYQQAQQSKELVDFVASDPILSRMTFMRAQGVPTEDILNDIQAIMQTMSNNNTQSDPYLDELDDNQRQLYTQMRRQQEEESQKRQQLEQQLASLQAERTVETVATHNSRVFDVALSELGLDYDQRNDVPKIQKAVSDLYPNIDPRTFKFNKQQAEAILNYAGLKRRSAKTTSKIQQVAKAKTAPRVLGGSKSSGTNKRQVPQQSLGSSIEDRRKALLNLGF